MDSVTRLRQYQFYFCVLTFTLNFMQVDISDLSLSRCQRNSREISSRLEEGSSQERTETNTVPKHQHQHQLPLQQHQRQHEPYGAGGVEDTTVGCDMKLGPWNEGIGLEEC